VPAADTGKTQTADGIDLVDENNRASSKGLCGLPGLLKKVPDAGRADPDEHFDEIGTADIKKRHIGFAGDGLGDQRLAATRRAYEKNALGNLAAQSLELLGVLEEFNDLLELLFGFIDARHIGERHFFLGVRPQPRLHLAEGPYPVAHFRPAITEIPQEGDE